MSLRDKLKNRVNQDAVAIHVEAWDETLYVKPLTCGDMSKLQRKHPDFLSQMSAESMVDLIILKCLDQEGEKAFSLDDKALLLRESMNVIASIAASILGSQVTEDYEKN